MSTIHYDINRISGLVTTASGTGHMSLPDGMAEEIRQVVVQPTISSNMYTVRLMNKDDNDMVMWTRDADGEFREDVAVSIYGNYKVNISGATSDDIFKVRLLYR